MMFDLLAMAYQADRPNASTHLDQAKVLAKEQIARLASGGESVMIISAARSGKLPSAGNSR